MTAYDRLVGVLREHGSTVRANGRRAQAQCPAHGDRNPSLSVTAIEGQALLHCFAGCAAADVLAALNLSLSDLFDEPAGARYDYTDRAGRVLRTVHRTPDKRFRQSGQTKGTAPLYRLPRVLDAVRSGEVCYVTEGEKDVLAVESCGAVATTSPMGAANWHKVDPSPLYGANVIVLPDRDEAGHRYARAVVASLTGRAANIAVALPRVGTDVADHIAAGHNLDELVPVELPEPPAADEVEAAFDAAAAFAREVALESHRLRVREAARVKVAAERAGEAPGFDVGLLGEVLGRPVEPPHRVEGLIPSKAATLFVGARKVAKTTIVLNLSRSLILGGDFLGRFPVRPVTGRVAMLNYEVSAAQLARWADEVGVPRDRLLLVNLRGRRNPLGHDDDRERLAELLRDHDVETLMVDPFGRAFVGKSQNDPGEVGAWLADLDRWARGEVGADDVVLSAHAGWNGERTRGASALEDWADSIVTLTRDPDDDQVRYLRAEGRDVLVEEDRLNYDYATRTLTLTGGGSRKAAAKVRHVEDLVPVVVEVVKAQPGITGYKLGPALRQAGATLQKGDELKAAKVAVERGLVTVENGPRNSKRYHPAAPSRTTYPDPPRPTPAGDVLTYPDLPLVRGGGQQGTSNDDLPRVDKHTSQTLSCDVCGTTVTARGMTRHITCEPEETP